MVWLNRFNNIFCQNKFQSFIPKPPHTVVVLLMVNLFLVNSLFAQGAALGCDANFYQTRAGTGGTALLRFTAANLSGGGTATNVWGALNALQVNGAGMNPVDGYIYGIKATGTRARLMKLGSTGVVDMSTSALTLGSIITYAGTSGVTASTTLTTTTDFTPTAGAFDVNGRFYFSGQGTGGISPPAIYRVDNFTTDVDGATAGLQIGVAQVYTLTAALANVGDYAFGPDGNLYGATGTNLGQARLVGNNAIISGATISNVGGIGSAFFNNQGEFFVYENGTGNLTQVLFTFGTGFPGTTSNPSTVVINGAAPLPTTISSTDGISCITFSADLAITKTNGTTTTLPSGSSTTYTIRVTNNGPSIAGGSILSDPVIAGLSKTAVTCSATPGQCVTPPTIAQLEGGLFIVPTMTIGQFYEILVTATITATGY